MAKKGLAGDALLYLASAATNALVPFLVLPLLARWLGPEGFGVVGTFMALVNAAAVVFGLSVHGRISVVFFRDGPQALPTEVGACFGVLALTALPMLALMLGFRSLLSALTGVDAGWLWTIWVAACGQFAVMIALAVWQVMRSPGRYAATQIGFSLAWGLVSLALVCYTDLGWKGRALGQAAGAATAAVACAFALSVRRLVDWHPSRWKLGPSLSFGLPLLPHSLSAIAMSSVDRLVLGSRVGSEAAGHYFLGFQIAALLSVMASAINQAWVPWMYQRLSLRTEEAQQEVVRITYRLYLLLLGGAALLAVSAPTTVRLIGGPAFASSAPLLAVLAPAAAFTGMYYFVAGYLFYNQRTGTLSIITVCCAALQVVLTLLLSGPYGALGVACATLCAATVYWAVTAATAQSIHPMPWMRFRLRFR